MLFPLRDLVRMSGSGGSGYAYITCVVCLVIFVTCHFPAPMRCHCRYRSRRHAIQSLFSLSYVRTLSFCLLLPLPFSPLLSLPTHTDRHAHRHTQKEEEKERGREERERKREKGKEKEKEKEKRREREKTPIKLMLLQCPSFTKPETLEAHFLLIYHRHALAQSAAFSDPSSLCFPSFCINVNITQPSIHSLLRHQTPCKSFHLHQS